MRKDWQLLYDDMAIGKRSYGQESLLTLGNGYLGWRGAPIMTSYSDDHYPGLYVAGVFNQTITKVADRDVINEDIVNLPNPQLMALTINGRPVAFKPVKRIVTLDMEMGHLKEYYVLLVPEGKLIVETLNLVNPIQMNQFGVRVTLTADFDAELVVQMIIDGTVTNQNVERYREFDSQELKILETTECLMIGRTKQSYINFALGAKTTSQDGHFEKVESTLNQLVHEGRFSLQKDTPINIQRIMAVATSYDSQDPIDVVKKSIEEGSIFKLFLAAKDYWKEVWDTADVVVNSDVPDLQRLIRLNIFHIRQAAQHQANQYLNTSVGSRGLTGEGYRGHIFWDEIFVVPYYAANDPKTARDILQYRIKRLNVARCNACLEDEIGALYPWQSGNFGDEQSQKIHLNTVSNQWEPDNSRLQRHVSLAIAYNFWIYTQTTDDLSLLHEGGLNVILEIARFWVNKAKVGSDGRYHISGVMGPDEYHESYPNATTGGIKDNAYTNVMVAWLFNWIADLSQDKRVNMDNISELLVETMQKAELMKDKLALVIDEEGIIAQYAGYFGLKSLDFDTYRKRYTDIHRIDRLLKAEGLSPDEYQVAKQADTLMLHYNLGAQKTRQLIEQLGYSLPDDWLAKNHDYYLERTVHGSTTSRPVFSGVEADLMRLPEAVDHLITAIGSDYYDIQGGTTAEGIHLGVMGETLAVIQNRLAGVSLHEDYIKIDPKLPENWYYIEFTQKFRGIQIDISMTHATIRVSADQPITLEIAGQVIKLDQNQLEAIVEVKK